MISISKKLCLSFLLIFVSMPLLAAGGEGINVKMEIYKVVNCIIFFGGLAYLLKKPVVEFFNNRQKNITTSLAMSESAVTEANKALEEIQRKMAKLDDELAGIEKTAREDIENERVRIKQAADHESERIIAQAKADCENMRREALLELKAYIVDLAVKDAESIVKETMNDAERSKLFTDFTEKLGARS